MATVIGAAVADLDPIIIKGSKFFYSSNDTQFFMRGVAYQYSQTQDPLADAAACKRDVPYMQQLRTNVIRTYYIDPTADHSECMSLLADAGIYVVSDLSSTTEAINRDDPEWNVALYDRYTSVIDELSKYNNTIGFFAGNEIANSQNTTDGMAFIKAAVRDMKAYIKEKDYRPMGVGYASADVASIRVALGNYLDCGTEADIVDFYGYNIYSWCGDSSYQALGYKARTEEFANYTVPVFFAEYGCNEVQPRTFTDVATLYGDAMSQVWSGGIVYMYFQTTNDYGLVSVVDNTSVSTMTDFRYYSKQIAAVSPSGTNKASYTPTNTALQDCPAIASSWEAVATPLPPAADQSLCDCIYDAAACVPDGSLSTAKMGQLLGVVCGYTDCGGIDANATTGKYGAYSMCGVKNQLAFALDKYYGEQSSAASACSFSGSASTKATTAPTGACSTQIKQAGAAGTGSVSAQATGNGGSGSSETSTSHSGAAGSIYQASSFSSFQIAAYTGVAVLTGMGMILL
ncbi:CAZyme family GH72 and CBM43 [Penicillium chermesinum]|uniref:1,3-beta-glucanosyltransferase n=1 Tax=Penicillium chermesinum TaxID=63820 RepID=A0A9W9TY02_9EURO|nr:CAZyme family GH72 and CBM43 [Penicillium chermesinum]KAJ5248598.1 CAZyme family GH72 and CBM43 [Penicillium chermesinum]KAJ6150713.1 CAZyme family GH72 and CBM43 [Penicillium chermesinum]